MVINAPILSYSTFLLWTGLIVKDLEVGKHPILAQSSHDGLVSLQAMIVLANLKRGYQNFVGIKMVGNHEIVVALLALLG